MKLAVIGGAGLLGSTTAFYAGSLNILSQIKLIDIKENMVMSHVLDMEQAFSTISSTKVTKSDYSEIDDCDIILITASLPERNVASRDEYLAGNLNIVKSVCEKISSIDTNKILINATNPLDVFNYYIYKKTDFNRNKIIGYSLNDTIRFKWSIAEVTGKDATKIEAYCIGEHGENKVPLFSQIKYKDKKISLTQKQEKQVRDIVNNWFKEYQQLKSGRTSGWTSAIGLTEIIKAIVYDSQEIRSCSTILKGEYGQNDISLGVPVKLGSNGIEEVVKINITDKEKKSFTAASLKVNKLIKSII